MIDLVANNAVIWREETLGAKFDIVAARHPGKPVLAADSVVTVGRRILPKAETEADVLYCLKLLSGRNHKVLTGVALIAPDGRDGSRLVETKVGFKRLSDAELAAAAGVWQERYRLRYDLRALVQSRRTIKPDPAAKVLTDDFAPVETMRAIPSSRRCPAATNKMSAGSAATRA